MGFTQIDYDSWERKEFLEYFKQTTIYMTVQMDITSLYKNLKQRGMRLYPALVYCTAKVINQYPEYRYAYDQQHRMGMWDIIHPFYTVPRKGNRALFSMKNTLFSDDFSIFYEAFVRDYAEAEVCGRLNADQSQPENICGISVVPGTHFSAFSFSSDPKSDFIPFTVFGKFISEGGRILLPVSGEFSHAVNDGFHISRFFEELDKIANNLFDE